MLISVNEYQNETAFYTETIDRVMTCNDCVILTIRIKVTPKEAITDYENLANFRCWVEDCFDDFEVDAYYWIDDECQVKPETVYLTATKDIIY